MALAAEADIAAVAPTIHAAPARSRPDRTELSVPRPLDLGFDPIRRAAQIWAERFGPADAMAAATSVMRVQQLLLAQFDTICRPHGLTFARYEALVLLTFSRTGALPMAKIGERLMVHPTSVTNTVQRLEAAGFVTREPRRVIDLGENLNVVRAVVPPRFALSPEEFRQIGQIARTTIKSCWNADMVGAAITLGDPVVAIGNGTVS